MVAGHYRPRPDFRADHDDGGLTADLPGSRGAAGAN